MIAGERTAALGAPTRARIQLALLAAALVCLVLFMTAVVALSADDLASSFERLGVVTVPAMVAAVAVLVTAMLPASVAAAGCGYVLGTAAGVLVALTGLGLSAIACAALARRAAGGTAARVLGRRADRASRWVADRPFRSIVISRLVPGTPFNGVSYALGLTDIRMRTIAAASVVGFAPRAFVYTAVGTSLHDLNRPESRAALVAAGLLLVGSLVVPALRSRLWHPTGRET